VKLWPAKFIRQVAKFPGGLSDIAEVWSATYPPRGNSSILLKFLRGGSAYQGRGRGTTVILALARGLTATALVVSASGLKLSVYK